jgi:hypothetical protein
MRFKSQGMRSHVGSMPAFSHHAARRERDGVRGMAAFTFAPGVAPILGACCLFLCASLVAAVDFEKRIVRIKWIGTHRDYDKIDVKEVRYGGDKYPIDPPDPVEANQVPHGAAGAHAKEIWKRSSARAPGLLRFSTVSADYRSGGSLTFTP